MNPAHLELETEESRFWSKVEKTEGCWNWTGAINSSGYGSFRRGTDIASAPRVAFELCVGPVGDSYVCHRCDNRRCVQPDHLFLGDHKVNMADMIAKGRHPWQKKGLIRAATVAAACVLANAVAAGSPTTNFGWTKPAVGADADQWGTYINSDLDGIDSTVFGIQGTANAACPKAGCTFTGGLTGTTASFSGASSFGSTLSVTGATTLTGGVSGPLSVSGATTLSSTLSVSGAATLSGGAIVTGSQSIAGAAGSFRVEFFNTGTANRWALVTDSTAESGSNAGSSFFLNRYSDAGAFIDSPIGVNRATGLVTIPDGLTLTGTLTLPTQSVNNSALDLINGGGGGCGSATTTCVLNTNGQGRITSVGSAATHAAMSASTAGALETNNGSSVSWATRASGYFNNCSAAGCGLAAGNGISGITRTGTGQYTVNFSVTFPNANYTIICTSGVYSGNGNAICADTGAHGTTSAGVEVVTGGNNPVDPTAGLNILIIQN